MTEPATPESETTARDVELISRVSHELRTPLTSVIGMLDVVLDPALPLDDGESAELLTLARREADQMQHLIDNLLSYARLQRATLVPSTEAIDLRPIITRALERQGDVHRRTHIAVAVGIGAVGDPALVLQIITNLIQNVHRYAPQGAVEIVVASDDAVTSISVSDEGPGVPVAMAADIFDTRIHSSKGLGLGLSLSRDLARSMQGDLVLDKARRGGATFTLTLPTARVKSSTSAERRPELSVATTPRAGLLVDVAAALAESSLDQSVAGLQGIYAKILGATSAVLMVPDGQGRFRGLGDFASLEGVLIPSGDELLDRVISGQQPLQIESLGESGFDLWAGVLGAESALVVPVVLDGVVAGVLALGWADGHLMPNTGNEVAAALGTIAAIAVDRSNLAHEVAFERSVRESVMEALPIAISVFVGDPPSLVYWNQRERDLLAIAEDGSRPTALQETQDLFEVSFADGTPLTLENAPVVAAIRSGRGTGPFFLRISRLDGRVAFTRTYCAPFFDGNGTVAGAVVTSEEVDKMDVEFHGLAT
ncbi:MAG: ATP-binding protein [Acidimicrobiia bacterium]|nr:ATP-binding protein [Acidimicrobiia bacterium]